MTGIGTKPTAPSKTTDELRLRSKPAYDGTLYTLDMCINQTDDCRNFILKTGSEPYKLFEKNKHLFVPGLIFKAEYLAGNGLILNILAEYKIEMFGGFITLLESETERQIDHLQQDGDYLISQENGKLYKLVQ